ncbi:D-alanyl-D-alanine carboxypeptidase (penicillin-binding protein 5/6) [Gracilibacillus halotolerans]|uniref:serine-type D-Ala-D-Ala carboxypeptidase n=1 Tax=Gracilibacillus halotolerans TaxID=74386 RepID=A0A841RL60_9BACI|nr:D-alanyl-D-alanine carboxypeptidase family protein [Gracilibacillus halotolerans]MBB6511704.1 D-alanyl-D-alanine carboxypeptidase (penicillin-binding protein 5/6) [Gracilibacillus halotolerans]
MVQKIFKLFILIFLFVSIVASPVMAHHHEESIGTEETAIETASPQLASNSKSAILIERDTGQILFDKNPHEKLSPASMTKIMTLLLIMEAIENGKITMDEKVRTSEYAASMGGSQIFLEEGEEMSVDELLKGIAIASANDASVAMAERIAGSEEAFVQLMNDRVKELGLKNTLFQNTTGLPAKEHYSTAYDMAMISKELLKYEMVTEYTSIYEDYLRKGEENEFWLVNTNKLVRFYDGVDGLKTGFTNEAKYCLTATAEKNGMRAIAVVFGAETSKDRNSDVSQLLDYAYSKFETKPIFQKNEKVTEFKWMKANREKVNVVTDDSVSLLYEKGSDLNNLETRIKINQDIQLPLKKNQAVGELEVLLDDEVVQKTDLIIQDDVKNASIWQLFQRTASKFLSR